MSLPRCFTAVLGAILCLTASVHAQDANATARQQWEDFNHYVLIARPDLAAANASALLAAVDDATLLDIVESSTRAATYESALDRAVGMDSLRELATEIRNRLQQARIERSRDTERIASDIDKLDDGDRPRANAIERLRGSGQFAAPQLLNALMDDDLQQQHPYVMAAMVSVGRPMVYPLAVALPHLEAVTQTQVAQVLGEIGYPRALPYLKQVIDAQATDPHAKRVAQAAYDLISRNIALPANVTAAELFLTLGQNHYATATAGRPLPGYSAAEGTGAVWSYVEGQGLIATSVPGEIFGDVLAMRAARQALTLNPQLDPALSLWLAASLRQENNAPADTDLPPRTPLPAQFYLEMAGPLRQHDVLDRALDNRDPVLALDAIHALGATAGTDALLNRAGTVQPMIRSLSYPDRRVRFGAAIAMTNAFPEEAFPGSHRIVPVLAEMVRQSEQRYALAVSRNGEVAARMQAILSDLGFQATSGPSLAALGEVINANPGLDLVMLSDDLETVAATVRDSASNYQLAMVPMLAMMSNADLPQATLLAESDPRLVVTLRSDDADELRAAVEQATEKFAGRSISGDEAHAYATSALTVLRRIAETRNPIFDVREARPALVLALSDDREGVAQQAGAVLALIDDEVSQSAIADAALDTGRPAAVRVPLLNSLAESARLYGGYLSEAQLDKLLELVKTSRGDLATAAARAHGALTLPTGNVVELITE